MLSNHGLLTASNAEFAMRLISALRAAQGERSLSMNRFAAIGPHPPIQ
jgi:hypothetical protein